MSKRNRNSLVSVIVPTKNSEKTIGACLKSIIAQTYLSADRQDKNLEIIVVDNNSTDGTKKIVEDFQASVNNKQKSEITNHKSVIQLYNKGPERSAQRNFGASKAKGEYLLFIDSDMELSRNVIKDCISLVGSYKAHNVHKVPGGIIIPEESVGEGFWAKCKALERSFYVGVDWIEAARFFPKKIFEEFKGYDEKLISGEDWDLNQRVRTKYEIERINSFIYHNEGNLSLISLLKKKFYYAGKIKSYSSKSVNKNEFSTQLSLVNRYKLFLSNPKKLFKNPILGFGVLFMITAEFFFGGIGYLWEKNI